MQNDKSKHRILILGVSGFIGSALYKELYAYFKVFGTYRTPQPYLKKNKQFFNYNIEEDDIYEILNATKPTIVISALRGDFHSQIIAHGHLAEYAQAHKVKILYLSSANVFDAYSKYPSYETDQTLSNSIYGHFKIKLENMLLRLPKRQVAIIRLPMVFGNNCPRINEIKENLIQNLAIEVFPNLIMNVTLDSKLTQQIHYIINRNKYGTFHLGSTDLVHHDEFVKELITIYSTQPLRLKRVYTTNEDRYLAVLTKYNKLP
ncbi:MAG: sugar nucleotide-binding protein, partial [Winogradskyella sp.]|nr:sugar nucleotide-binding protein [Winogradskyella sp.]